MFLFAEVQKLHPSSGCRLFPREDIIYDAYMQELNAVVLYVVIFVPSQFWLASESLILQCLSGILQEPMHD